MKPWISLIPRSVYWPLRHMSHSPTAQLGQGTGSGRRTIPTTRSPFLNELLSTWINDAAEGFMSQHQARLSRRRPAVFPLDDLDVRPADADGYRFDQDRALTQIGLRNIFVPG